MEIFKFSSVLFFFLASIPVQVFSQDNLYKKDSSVLKVNIINIEGRTITYKIPGESPGETHYLSKSLLDSLKYSDGKLLNFTNDFVIRERPIKKYNRNNFDLKIISLLRGNGLNFDYERTSKTGKISIVTGLFINLKNNINWEDLRPLQINVSFIPYSFFVRTGISFYPFNSSLVRTSSLRFSTGLSVLLGSYKKEVYNTYSLKTDRVFATSLMWNITEGVYLGNNFEITGTIETSILPFLTFICPQVGLSVGF